MKINADALAGGLERFCSIAPKTVTPATETPDYLTCQYNRCRLHQLL
jgi:hypothetical protein